MRLESRRPVRDLNVFQPQQFFLERERSESGEVVSVATVFLTNRECPWHCIYCDLWKNTTTESVPLGAIPAQVDFALTRLCSDEFREPLTEPTGTCETRPPNARQIKLYNAGSFFDPKAIPPEDLPAIADRVRDFERVIVECHPALIGDSAIRFRDLLQPARLEVAMGLEVANDSILVKLNKRMTLAMFQRAAEFLISHGIAVRVFVMVKPPYVRSNAEALEFARRSIDFAFDCGASVVSLIPARFGPAELDELARSGDFAPPTLDTVEAALDYGIAQRRGRVFLDLWDIEQLAGNDDCALGRIARLREMNFSQMILPRADSARTASISAP